MRVSEKDAKTFKTLEALKTLLEVLCAKFLHQNLEVSEKVIIFADRKIIIIKNGYGSNCNAAVKCCTN